MAETCESNEYDAALTSGISAYVYTGIVDSKENRPSWV
jgi:hypothetical protein